MPVRMIAIYSTLVRGLAKHAHLQKTIDPSVRIKNFQLDFPQIYNLYAPPTTPQVLQ